MIAHSRLPSKSVSRWPIGQLLQRKFARQLALALLLATTLFATAIKTLPAQASEVFEPVDTALIIAVDVSNSVDERRYHL